MIFHIDNRLVTVLPYFPGIKLFTLNEVFGNWRNAQKTHFNDGGVLKRCRPTISLLLPGLVHASFRVLSPMGSVLSPAGKRLQ